jgi:hypothetical protein
MPREARLRRRPPPGRMRVPANAHPRALSQCLRAGGSGDASGRLWRASAVPLRAALACIRQPPSGAALACVRTPSGNRRSASGAALACVQTDRRPRRPATAVRLRAALGCIPATAIRHARQTCPEADRGVTTKIYVNDVNDDEDSKIF